MEQLLVLTLSEVPVEVVVNCLASLVDQLAVSCEADCLLRVELRLDQELLKQEL